MGRVQIHYPGVVSIGQLEMDVLSTVQMTSVHNASGNTGVDQIKFVDSWKWSDYKQIAISMRGSARSSPYYDVCLGIGGYSGNSYVPYLSWYCKKAVKGDSKIFTFTDEETMGISMENGLSITVMEDGTQSLSWKLPCGCSLSATAGADGIVTATSGIGAYNYGYSDDVSLTFTLYGIRE